MNWVIFRFDSDFDVFLLPNHRDVEFKYFFKGNPSLKNLIEAVRVPHTEVGKIVVNQQIGTLNDQAQNGDMIRVYSIRHSGAWTNWDVGETSKPIQPRFILDNHLGKLAIYLRMLGFDALYRNDYQDDELTLVAAQEGRILLTRDRGLLMRRRIACGYYVRSMLPGKQVVEVLQRYRLYEQIRPFRRCLRCNEPLAPVEKATIQDRLEPLTRQYYDEFHLCPKCNQIYWKGSHYERMQNYIHDLISNFGGL
jgi:hypothetical protein